MAVIPPGRPARQGRHPADRRAERAAVEDPAVVLAAAARFLEGRARSVQEVRRHLAGAGYRPDLVEGAVIRLGELGMLDDWAFARAWVGSRDRAHPRGARVLREELRRKGIEPAISAAVLRERDGLAAGDGDEDPRSADREEGPVFGQLGVRPAPGRPGEPADVGAARRLLERQASALGRVTDPRRRRQRAFALLVRNGFDLDLAGRLVRELEPPPVEVPEDPDSGAHHT